MIKSFKHKGLKQFFETGKKVGIQAKHAKKLRMQLAAIDTAQMLDDIDLPGFFLHPLKGNRSGNSSPKTENITLANIVNRKNQTGYLFGNIINDLGESVEVIMQNSKLIQMTYAYARRSAATVLYIQGVIDLNAYDHNLAFFKSMQLTTGHTVEFQEQAFSDSVDYMQTYSPAITRLLIQTAAAIAQSPSRIPPKGIFSDSEIIKILIDTYVEAMQA